MSFWLHIISKLDATTAMLVVINTDKFKIKVLSHHQCSNYKAPLTHYIKRLRVSNQKENININALQIFKLKSTVLWPTAHACTGSLFKVIPTYMCVCVRTHTRACTHTHTHI